MIFDGKIPKSLFRDFLLTKIVALFTRAWIEIVVTLVKNNFLKVALFTRVWIEILNIQSFSLYILSKRLLSYVLIYSKIIAVKCRLTVENR